MNGRPLAPHGTIGAYQRHRRNDENPCDPCQTFALAYWAEQRARRRGRPATRPKPAAAPTPPTVAGAVRVKWLLPPPGGSTPLTEYARLNTRGHYNRITPEEAGELLQEGHTRVYVRTVSLWTRIAADPTIGPGWWRTTAADADYTRPANHG